MKNSSALLDTLLAHAAEAAPHEALRNDYFEACERRDTLNRKILETPRWESAKEFHSEICEVLKKVEHLFLKKADAERGILSAWKKVIEALVSRSNEIRSELESLAGPAVNIGQVQINPQTFEDLSHKLIQIQVECLGNNHDGHFMNTAILGRKVIATLEVIVQESPKIQLEAQALAAAAVAYNKTFES